MSNTPIWPSRAGRPRRKPLKGRVPLSLRVSPALLRRLAAACRASGRSQSQEAELRLEISLRENSL